MMRGRTQRGVLLQAGAAFTVFAFRDNDVGDKIRLALYVPFFASESDAQNDGLFGIRLPHPSAGRQGALVFRVADILIGGILQVGDDPVYRVLNGFQLLTDLPKSRHIVCAQLF